MVEPGAEASQPSSQAHSDEAAGLLGMLQKVPTMQTLPQPSCQA